MTLGLRILKRKRKVDASFVERFRTIPVAMYEKLLRERGCEFEA